MAKYAYKENKEEVSIETQEHICPLTIAQNVISGRWKVIILWHLSEKEIIRFSQLQRLLPGISKGILTRQLRELEEDDIIHREVYKEVPPKVEYSLTKEGKEFIPVLETMKSWGQNLIKKKINESNLEK